MNAIGFLPHTLFLVDFLVRQMHKSIAFRDFCWAIFGPGALLGPILLGKFSNIISLKNSILLSFLIKSLAVFMPVFLHNDISFYISSFIVVFFTPGLVTIISAYSLCKF